MKKDQIKILLIIVISICLLLVVGLIIYFVKSGSTTNIASNSSSSKSTTLSSSSTTSLSSTSESSPLTVTEGELKFSLPAGWEYTKDPESGTYTFVNTASDTGVVKIRLSALGHGGFPKYELFKNDGLNLKVTSQEIGEEVPITETIRLSYMTYRTIPGGYTLLGVKYADRNRYPTAVFVTKFENGVFTSYTAASKVDEGGSTVTTINELPKLGNGDTITDLEIIISGVNVKEDFTPVFDLLEGFLTSLKN